MSRAVRESSSDGALQPGHRAAKRGDTPVAGAQPSPRGQLLTGREPGHVDAHLGDDDLSGPAGHAGDRLQTAHRLAKRGYRGLRLDVEPVDHGGQVIDVVQVQPQHHHVVIVEPALQRQL